MTDWQPIETAPKWCWVLLASRTSVWPGYIHGVVGALGLDEQPFENPTHWANFPKPPRESGEK
jgi:hypothetical protein